MLSVIGQGNSEYIETCFLLQRISRNYKVFHISNKSVKTLIPKWREIK